MKIKRSARTIVLATTGLLLYTLIIAWYDGFGSNVENVDAQFPSTLSPVLQRQLTSHLQKGFRALYFVYLSEPEAQAYYDLSKACHREWLIKWQINRSMTAGFPKQSFDVIRYRTPQAFVQAMTKNQQAFSKPQKSFEGRVLSTDGYWLNMKFLMALGLAVPILSSIYKASRISKP
ncbi:hypothetical protein HQ531_10345 [bacterium]|nr:hypothetical protein [bacterium]